MSLSGSELCVMPVCGEPIEVWCDVLREAEVARDPPIGKRAILVRGEPIPRLLCVLQEFVVLVELVGYPHPTIAAQVKFYCGVVALLEFVLPILPCISWSGNEIIEGPPERCPEKFSFGFDGIKNAFLGLHLWALKGSFAPPVQIGIESAFTHFAASHRCGRLCLGA